MANQAETKPDIEAGSESELSTTVHALRDTFEEEYVTQRWSRELALAGLLLGFAGVLLWGLVVQEQARVLIISQDAMDVSEVQADLQWAGTAIAQSVRAHLLIGGSVRFADGNDAVALGRVALPGDRSAYGWQLHSRLSQASPQSNLLQVDLELRDAAGDQYHQASLTGSPAALADLAARCSQQVQTWLSLDPLTESQAAQARAELPANDGSDRLYARALQALEREEARLALELLEAADDGGDAHPLVKLALGEAWSLLGYQSRARDYFQQAYLLRDPLSRTQELRIEGRYRRSLNEWRRAEEIYRALWEFYPDDINYGLALAGAQTSSADYTAALATLDTLSGIGDDDARVVLSRAIVLWYQGDWQAGLPFAKQAVARARRHGGDLLAAALRWQYALTAENPADALLREAQDLFAASGNRRGQAQVLQNLARSARGRGDLAAAAQLLERALTLSVDDDAATQTSQSELAIVLDLYGRLNEGLRMKEAALANLEQRQLAAGIAITRENIGISLLKLGRLADAQAMFRRAGKEFAVVEDKIGLAWIPYQQARVLSEFGQLVAARTLAQEAIENAAERPEGELERHATFEVAKLDMRMGNLHDAQLLLEELIAGYEQVGLNLDAAESRQLLSRVLRQTGDYAQAASEIEAAVQVFRHEQAGYYLLNANIEAFDLLGATAARRGLTAMQADSRRTLCRTFTTTRSEYQLIDLRARVRALRCAMDTESLDVLRAEAAELIDAAETAGLFEAALDANLLYADLMTALGRSAEAMLHWQEVAAQAEMLGWSLSGFVPGSVAEVHSSL